MIRAGGSVRILGLWQKHKTHVSKCAPKFTKWKKKWADERENNWCTLYHHAKQKTTFKQVKNKLETLFNANFCDPFLFFLRLLISVVCFEKMMYCKSKVYSHWAIRVKDFFLLTMSPITTHQSLISKILIFF